MNVTFVTKKLQKTVIICNWTFPLIMGILKSERNIGGIKMIALKFIWVLIIGIGIAGSIAACSNDEYSEVKE